MRHWSGIVTSMICSEGIPALKTEEEEEGREGAELPLVALTPPSEVEAGCGGEAAAAAPPTSKDGPLDNKSSREESRTSESIMGTKD